MKTPLLFELFQSIRKEQIFGNPGLDNYYLVFDLLIKDYRVSSFDELKFVLETIWLKNHSQRKQFNQMLDARKGMLVEILETLNQVRASKSSGTDDKAKESEAIKDIKRPSSSAEEKPDEKSFVKQPDKKEENQVTTDTESSTSFAMGRLTTQSQIFSFSYEEEGNKKLLETPYLYTTDYFPVKSRHLQQAWRGLKNKLDIGENEDLDIQKTIRRTADQGYFSDLIFQREFINELELFILLDKSDSMIAEIEFGKELCESARLSNIHKNVDPWYFYKIPQSIGSNDYTLTNEDYTESIGLKRLFSTRNQRNKSILKKNVVVLVYSDCGTLANEYDEERIVATRKFITYLYKNTAFAAWLNPAPRSRWPWTNTEIISKLVPMFETTRTDIENAIAALRGRLFNSAK